MAKNRLKTNSKDKQTNKQKKNKQTNKRKSERKTRLYSEHDLPFHGEIAFRKVP